MKQLSLLATLCILSVSSILEAIVDGTYSVTESWTVRIDYDNFAGGHSGTNTFTGSESGSIEVTGGEFRILDGSSTAGKIPAADKDHSFYQSGSTYTISGSRLVQDLAYLPSPNLLLHIGIFRIFVPIQDGEIPVFTSTGTYRATGSSINNLSGGASMGGSSIDVTASSTISMVKTGEPDLPPTITGHPSSVTITEGESASFSVSATGTQPFTYAWEYSDDGNNWYAVPGAGSTAVLQIDQPPLGISGRRYRVTVSNALGSRTSLQAVLTIEPDSSALWRAATPGPDGWMSLDWFGWFKDMGGGFIYHLEHGWLVAHGGTTASFHLYDTAIDCWWWTSDTAYPFLYKYGANAGWYGYERGCVPGQRWFYRYSDGQWVQEGDLNAAPPAVFALIPAGTFTMGSPTSELGRWSNETQHTVTLTRAFYLQTTEVTKAQWDAVAAQGPAHGYTDLPAGRNGYNGDASGTHPVTEVSWVDVVKWLNLKSELEGLTPCYRVGGSVMKTGTSTPTCDFTASGYRLPTESEWEYACRAGTTTAFYSGSITYTFSSPLDPNLDLIGWYGGNSGGNTHPVGGKQANAWELYDMSGNVYEWCWDWYGTYPGTVTDPAGASSGTLRVNRGGIFNLRAENCRSAYRNHAADPDIRINSIGFRPARTASP
ncbi:MAG: SUMF1/EgtB/PvdO family nonheme iron enzyme [Oceanipulchritudo sp.]